MKYPEIKLQSFQTGGFLLLFTFTAIDCRSKTEAISCFCGSAGKPPLEESARRFHETTAIPINLTFGGSGQVLSQMIISKKGDIFIPGSSDYMEKAIKRKVVIEGSVQTIAYLIPSILVSKGNPHHINSLEDLTKNGISIAIGNPLSVCIGLYAVELLKMNNLTEAASKNIVTYTQSCSQTVSLLMLGNVDAIIGWRVFQKWYPQYIEAINIEPEKIPRITFIPAGISIFSLNKKNSKKFIDFLASSHGKNIFKKWGYITSETEAKKIAPKARIGGTYQGQ